MTFIRGKPAADILVTAVLHKNLNDELKILCLLQFFPEVAQNSPRIPRVFYVQRNPSVFQVFQVCGLPDRRLGVASKHHLVLKFKRA